jgi:type IV secretory pathway component VirB8
LQFGIKNITSYTIKHLEKIENINQNLIVDVKMIASDKQQVEFSSNIKSMFDYEQQYYEILSE